jgi:hypothetical protein
MVNNSKKEYLEAIRDRYQRAGRRHKTKILDEFCEVCGYHRKYAIELLNRKRNRPKRRPGPKRTYDDAVVAVLKDLWLLMNRPCSKLLKAGIGLWFPYYQQDHQISPRTREKALKISPASIDRVLQPVRKKYGSHGLGATRAVHPLKHQVPIRTHHSNIDRPGAIQADTVAHGGDSVEGDFIWSVTMTDVFSQWTESRVVWNKGYYGVAQAIEQIENALPFPIHSFHTDNGGEFLNHHLYRYFRDREIPIVFTRTRPDHKDDNAHVEQKNWAHIRLLLGYQRIDNPELVDAINKLNETWSILQNFFTANQKLKSKTKVGSRYVRRYEKLPCTSAQRLLESPHVNEAMKTHLAEKLANTNPIKLKKSIDRRQDRILSHAR